jgi:hypothetical protein
MSEGIVIATAIKHAKEWAKKRGYNIDEDNDFSEIE